MTRHEEDREFMRHMERQSDRLLLLAAAVLVLFLWGITP